MAYSKKNLPKKKPRRLVEALTQIDKKETLGESYFSKICSLAHKHSCCSGIGVRYCTKGPYTVAQPCPCISFCKKCMGNCHYFDSKKKIYSCKKPLPLKICSLIDKAHIPARYYNANLATIRNVKHTADLYQKLVTWAQQYNSKTNDFKGLLISGDIGIGKTYILASLAKLLTLKGITVRFVDFFQLISEIKACYSDNQSEQTLLNPLLAVDVLIIDELGKGRNTDYERTILDQLIMGRYNQNKTLIASTNYLLTNQNLSRLSTTTNEPQSSFEFSKQETLEQRVGKRIYSRLIETTYFAEIRGHDLRLEKGISWIVS